MQSVLKTALRYAVILGYTLSFLTGCNILTSSPSSDPSYFRNTPAKFGIIRIVPGYHMLTVYWTPAAGAFSYTVWRLASSDTRDKNAPPRGTASVLPIGTSEAQREASTSGYSNLGNTSQTQYADSDVSSGYTYTYLVVANSPAGSQTSSDLEPGQNGATTTTHETVNAGPGDVPSISYQTSTGTVGTANAAMTVTPSFTNDHGAAITDCSFSLGHKKGSLWQKLFKRKDSNRDLPAGLNGSIVDGTCVISGTPTNTLSPTEVWVTATNSYGSNNPTDLTNGVVYLSVNPGLPAISYSGATATVGVPVTGITPSFVSDGGASITSCSVRNGSRKGRKRLVPDWLSLSPSGDTCTITGTPTSVLSATTLTVVATSSNGDSANTNNFPLTVVAGVPFLTYTNATGTYNSQLTITPSTLTSNGADVTSCTIASGTLPPGLNNPDSSTCVISGTPTVPSRNPYNVTVVASNSAGSSTAAPLQITINDGAPTLSYVGGTGTATATVHDMFTLLPDENTIALLGNGSSVTQCTMASKPGWLNVNSSTCALSGTPADGDVMGPTQYTLTAYNGIGSNTGTVNLQVVPNVPIISYSDSSGTYGSLLTINPSLDQSGASVTNCVATPSLSDVGLGINTSTCVISGTPNTSESSTLYHVTATNSAGDSNSASFHLTLNAIVPTFGYSSTTGTEGSGITINPNPALSNNGATASNCRCNGGRVPCPPAGLSIDSSTCVISGTPSSTMSSTNFGFVVSNSAGDSSVATLALTIVPGAPVVNYGGGTATVGDAFSDSPSINDNGAAVTSCSLSAWDEGKNIVKQLLGKLDPKQYFRQNRNCVGWLCVGAAPGCALTGTPGAGDVGSNSWTLTAYNSAGSGDTNISITVDANAPTFSYLATTGTEGTALSFGPTDVNGNGDDSITYTAGSCTKEKGKNSKSHKHGKTRDWPDPGLSLDPSGTISGTPTATDTGTDFTVCGTNSGGSYSTDFLLTIVPGSPVVSYTGNTATVNDSFSDTPTINNNGAAITACTLSSRVSGKNFLQRLFEKPDSKNISKSRNCAGWLCVGAAPDCQLSGTPGAGDVGSDSFNLQVNNSAGSGAQGFTITVGPNSPTLSYTDATGSEGQSLTINPATLSGNGDDSITCTPCGRSKAKKGKNRDTSNWPLNGLTLNSSTCVISGTPTDFNTSLSVCVDASNSAGDNQATFNLNVAGYPTLAYAAGINSGSVGASFGPVTPTTLDGNGASVTGCTMAFPPPWLNIDNSTCVISGTPTGVLLATTYNVTATNAVGASSAATVELKVGPPLPLAPGSFSITSAIGGNAQVVLTWGASSNATGYVITRGTSTGVYPTNVATVSSSTLTYTDTTVTNGTGYYYMVTATNGGGSTNATQEAYAFPHYFSLYVSDWANSRIAGMPGISGPASYLGSLLSDPSAANQFVTPIYTYVAWDGSIYVADSGGDNPSSCRIAKFTDPNQNLDGSGSWTTYGNCPSKDKERASQGVFTRPVGVAMDSSHRIYIADYGSHNIVRMDDMSGTNWNSFGGQGSGSSQFNQPAGLAIDSSDRIYVADSNNNRIVRFANSLDGTGWTAHGTYGSGANQFSAPYQVWIGNDQKIYVGDGGNNRIVRMNDMTGAGWTTLSVNGSNSLSGSYGVCVTSGGKIAISNFDTSQIVQVDDMSGTNWKSYGAGGNGPGQFQNPFAVFCF